MTISPSDVSSVAEYRFAGSMPIAGGSENCWRWGAEPSNGGNSGIGASYRRSRRDLAAAPPHIWAGFVSPVATTPAQIEVGRPLTEDPTDPLRFPRRRARDPAIGEANDDPPQRGQLVVPRPVLLESQL